MCGLGMLIRWREGREVVKMKSDSAISYRNLSHKINPFSYSINHPLVSDLGDPDSLVFIQPKFRGPQQKRIRQNRRLWYLHYFVGTGRRVPTQPCCKGCTTLVCAGVEDIVFVLGVVAEFIHY